MRQELDQTARAAMKARKLENKMIQMKTKAAEQIFSKSQADIKSKVRLAEEAAEKSTNLAKEISEETDKMNEELKSLQGSTQKLKTKSKAKKVRSHKMTQVPDIEE